MIIILAHLLDIALGEPRWLWSRLPHPAALMGRAVRLVEGYNSGAQRRLKGALAITALVMIAFGVGDLLSRLGPIVEILVLAILLAQRSLVEHVAAVARGLTESVAEGRRAVGMIVGRKTDTLGRADIIRASIESGAENLSDGVIAPAFWFLIGGLPGVLVYKMVNTADSMIGYRTAQYEEFGWAAARLDDLLNIAPARFTGVLIALASGKPRAVRVMWRDARRHRSPNAGWPEAAMAGALDLALSGPRLYDSGPTDDPFLNPGGRHEGRVADIDLATRLIWRAWGLWMIGLSVGVSLG